MESCFGHKLSITSRCAGQPADTDLPSLVKVSAILGLEPAPFSFFRSFLCLMRGFSRLTDLGTKTGTAMPRVRGGKTYW